MNGTDILGFWELPSVMWPGRSDYYHFAANGRMIAFIPVRHENRPEPSWVHVHHWYRLDDAQNLLLRIIRLDRPEEPFVLHRESADSLVMQKKEFSLLEWRFRKLSWETPPEWLQKHLDAAQAQMNDIEAKVITPLRSPSAA